MSRGDGLLLAGVLLLAGSAAAVLALTGRAGPGAGAREFHRLVGGVALDPSACSDCARDDGPVPAGAAFCPDGGWSVPGSPVLPP